MVEDYDVFIVETGDVPPGYDSEEQQQVEANAGYEALEQVREELERTEL